MILKELRISRHLSQEQLAQMSGLNVRTIQRIESGKNASLESQKCLAAALEVDLSTLNQEKFVMDKSSDNWQTLPVFLKIWFELNILQTKPTRRATARGELMLHIGGFVACCLALISDVVLLPELMLLACGYLMHFVIWQGDKYSIWYDESSD